MVAESAQFYDGNTACTSIVGQSDTLNIQATNEGYAVSVPSLLGCRFQGKTEKEALRNIEDAIQEYLATVQAPSKDIESRYVEVEQTATNSQLFLGPRIWL